MTGVQTCALPISGEGPLLVSVRSGARVSMPGMMDTVLNLGLNDADPAKRAARLALLARFRGAVHQVADFSKIEG